MQPREHVALQTREHTVPHRDALSFRAVLEQVVGDEKPVDGPAGDAAAHTRPGDPAAARRHPTLAGDRVKPEPGALSDAFRDLRRSPANSMLYVTYACRVSGRLSNRCTSACRIVWLFACCGGTLLTTRTLPRSLASNNRPAARDAREQRTRA